MLVRLKCTYVYDGGEQTSGVIDVSDTEGARLIKLKVATPVSPKKLHDELLPVVEGEDDSDDNDSEEGDSGKDDKGSGEKVVSVEEAIESLCQIKEINAELALGLFHDKIYSLEDVAEMESTDLLESFQGIGKKSAQRIIDAAKKHLSH